MIDRDDLRAATAAGVITEAQAVSLSTLAQNRLTARSDLRQIDEPFELFKGFNEIFIVVGLCILAAGWAASLRIFLAQESSNVLLVGALTAALIWGLSEYFVRRRRMVAPAIAEIATGAISGAVGTFANIDPRVEEHVCKQLGLTPEPISTQVIPRDRHAMFFATLGVIASSMENIATEIRHMQRTEVLEAEEFFSPGQKGSSAMPHKRNPVLSENLTGLARLVRMSVTPAMENVTLWHERDISHSSVERTIGPDTTITLDFALNRLAGLIEKLVIYPETMLANMNKFRGLVMSQRVLLALTQAGVSREDSYKLVQRNAMKVWEKGADFKTELLADPEVIAALTPSQIEEKFDIGYHTKHVDTIFARVFGKD